MIVKKTVHIRHIQLHARILAQLHRYRMLAASGAEIRLQRNLILQSMLLNQLLKLMDDAIRALQVTGASHAYR
ncbi:hypothetical protein D3C73_1445790 [compost metagenome]